MTNFYFTRHGESQANADHIFAGWLDSPLTEKGRKEAEEEGKRLKSEGTTFDLIISSTLSRAYDTAVIIAKQIGYAEEAIIRHDLLKERNVGDIEGKPKSILDDIPPEVDAIGMSGGETRAAFAERVTTSLDFIRKTSNGHQKVLIVAHAGWYKMAIRLLEQADKETFYLLPSPQNNKVIPLPL